MPPSTRGEARAGESRLAWVAVGALGLLLVLLCCHLWQGPDIFYHLYLGGRVLETRTAQPPDNLIIQQPAFINIYWLFQIVCRSLHEWAGVWGVAAFFAAAWLGVMVNLAHITRARSAFAIGLPLLLVSLLVLQTRFEPRPEVVSYLFLSLQLRWLCTWSLAITPSWSKLAAFGAIEMLWANTHGYFVLGPMIVGARLVAAIADPERRVEVPALSRLLVVALLASIASPFGVRTWECVFRLAVFLRAMGSGIHEFAPPVGGFLQLWTVWVFWTAWGATGVAATWMLVRGRRDVFVLLLAAAGLGLSATSFRNLPFLPLFCAPLWGVVLRRWRERWGRAPAVGRWGSGSAVVVIVASLGLSVWVVQGGFHRSLRSESGFGIGLPPHAYPTRFRAYLDAQRFQGRLFNNAADGGYLEHAFPDLVLFMDSRYTDADLVEPYFAALRSPEAFMQLHARYRFDGALLKVTDNGKVLKSLIVDPRWEIAYGDLHRVFVVDAASPVTRTLSRDEPRFYQGEDLTRRANGLPAIQWVNLLIQTGDRRRLLAALDAFAGSDAVPSFVIEYALRLGLQQRDAALVERARALHPKLHALDDENRQRVEKLLRAVPTVISDNRITESPSPSSPNPGSPSRSSE